MMGTPAAPVLSLQERRISAFIANIHYATKKREPLTVWYSHDHIRLGPKVPPKDGVIVGTYTSDTPQEWIREDLVAVLEDYERQVEC